MNLNCRVGPLSVKGRALNVLVYPLALLVSGAPLETPKRTHPLNRVALEQGDLFSLSPKWMIHCVGDANALKSDGLRRHMPLFGGWTLFVVMKPTNCNKKWRCGWKSGRDVGLSQVLIEGPVRMMIGPGDVDFFGIEADSEVQVRLEQIGTGRIGQKGPHSRILLL